MNASSPGVSHRERGRAASQSAPRRRERSLVRARSARPGEASPPMALDGVRVLVVEASADLRDLFAVALGGFGANVTTVGSAAAAVEAFGRTAPDAIVCDIFLPEHDGYSVIRRVRARERGRGRTPAIAVTAYDSWEGRAKARAAGFDEQLVKPVEIEDLARAIARLLAFPPPSARDRAGGRPRVAPAEERLQTRPAARRCYDRGNAMTAHDRARATREGEDGRGQDASQG